MAIVTATEVTLYTDISASAGTITSSGLIPIVQARINQITNNYFVSDMYLQGTLVFTSAAGTIVSTNRFDDEGFIAGDEIYIYHSYRNDGYKTVGSVTTVTITVSSTDSVISEPSGRSILVSVVDWPDEIKYIAAQMVKYDYDDRASKSLGVNSETLGPYSVSYANSTNSSGGSNTPYGYPQEIIDSLTPYILARFK
jgi:hypothetical protein